MVLSRSTSPPRGLFIRFETRATTARVPIRLTRWSVETLPVATALWAVRERDEEITQAGYVAAIHSCSRTRGLSITLASRSGF
jgi:hypothetical protein